MSLRRAIDITANRIYHRFSAIKTGAKHNTIDNEKL